ncbi:MAG TPA: DUF445 family protein [Gemmatimonadaceae bacterium]|nr:DUF445 family protein [Gemmatimonadaceae bacterium]
MAIPQLRPPDEPARPSGDTPGATESADAQASSQRPIPAVPRVPIHREDPNKQIQLDRMKRRATGLLIAASVVFVITVVLESRYPWLGYVRATAEASMVGGLADWFAITALFRHPLGIPIPHTAIIPSRKDRIGRSLGGFVQNNFLSREVIAARLDGLRIAERIARWISDPANSRRIAHHVASGLAGTAQVLRDDDVQSMIDRAIVERVRKTQVAPVLGNILSLLTSDNRHQELLDEALRLISEGVQRNEELIRQRIREESPWWLPEAVDDRIHDKVVDAIENTLRQVAADPGHPLRDRFDRALKDFIDRLRTSPELIARAEQIKEDMLSNPAVRQFSGSIWGDVKQALARYAERKETDPPGAVEQGLMKLGAAVQGDPELMAKVDGWILDAVLYAVEQFRGEVAHLISYTVGQWDAEETSKKIELQIGKDLQFVRINGTLVGGLVGLILYTASQFFGR